MPYNTLEIPDLKKAMPYSTFDLRDLIRFEARVSSHASRILQAQLQHAEAITRLRAWSEVIHSENASECHEHFGTHR